MIACHSRRELVACHSNRKGDLSTAIPFPTVSNDGIALFEIAFVGINTMGIALIAEF